jgi:imidazole glycerol-phosphate synthase subunit HisH
MSHQIVIVDYGMGNLGSIQNMLKKCGAKSLITNSATEISKAEKLILPGVGHFDRGMEKLRALNLVAVLNERVMSQKIPVLGICLGMQLMCKGSEEGTEQGLGWIDAQFQKFKNEFANQPLKVPHMAWNYVQHKKQSKLTHELPEPSRFYFVHSYHAVLKNEGDALFTTNYGYNFVSAFERENILGVQFHPEKSHKFGQQIFQNFIQHY